MILPRCMHAAAAKNSQKCRYLGAVQSIGAVGEQLPIYPVCVVAGSQDIEGERDARGRGAARGLDAVNEPWREEQELACDAWERQSRLMVRMAGLEGRELHLALACARAGS